MYPPFLNPPCITHPRRTCMHANNDRSMAACCLRSRPPCHPRARAAATTTAGSAWPTCSRRSPTHGLECTGLGALVPLRGWLSSWLPSQLCALLCDLSFPLPLSLSRPLCPTTVLFIINTTYRNRKTARGRAWGLSLLGVSAGSLTFHSSWGKWRSLGRKIDYWAIAISSGGCCGWEFTRRLLSLLACLPGACTVGVAFNIQPVGL